MRTVTPAWVRARLAAIADGPGDELALLDVREQGVHYLGHPFFASSMPLSHLERMAPALLPRKDAPVVLLDGGEDDLAERAATKLTALGYTDVAILAGGCAGWAADGGELFSGVNVPSKAFGEFVEHNEDTPRVPPGEIARMRADGRRMVILDSRPFDEYHRMNIPGGIDVPGAELVWRVHDLAPDPDTLVVVNCAGRTRSIIGCQSLRNAGIANPVVALKDGTMGWDLAGLECERGAERRAPEPSADAQARALEAARRVAQRFEVRFATRAQVAEMTRDERRTIHLLDVRTREEFESRRIAGSRHAPGGQLVQATDEYVATRGARIVLVDPQRVRAVMTASWLNQMGWHEVFVLEPEGEDGFDGWDCARGPATEAPAGGLPSARTLSAQELATMTTTCAPGVAVIDLSSSLAFRRRHVPGAWWGVRARLDEARRSIGDGLETIVLACPDGVLSRLAAPEAERLWPGARVSVLEGGMAAWTAAALPTSEGHERLTTTLDDVWYKPYDHGSDYEKHARAYLEWEVALVAQIARDPTIRFRRYG